VLLMMPLTYMNLSGEAVGEAARFYKIPSDHVLVIYDDVSLPLGKLRIRDKGSAGGHNGIKNIIAHLGTDVFPRVRSASARRAIRTTTVVDWVIGSFLRAGEEDRGRGARPRARRGGGASSSRRRRPEARRTAFTRETTARAGRQTPPAT